MVRKASEQGFVVLFAKEKREKNDVCALQPTTSSAEGLKRYIIPDPLSTKYCGDGVYNYHKVIIRYLIPVIQFF